MAALDLTALALDATHSHTLTGTTVQQVDLPVNARKVPLRSITTAGTVASTGTDGGAPTTAVQVVNADTIVEYPVPGTNGGKARNLDGGTIYTSGTSSGVVRITPLA